MRRLGAAPRHSPRFGRTWAVVAGTALVLTVTGQALADERGDVLDSLPSSAWGQSIVALESSTTVLDERITYLEPRISPFETRTTEGEETVITLSSDILFAFGEATIEPEAERRIGELLADVPDGATVQVHGHTDSIGGRDFNQALSEDRAETVAEVILADRPDLQLEVEGFGMDDPVEPNATDGEDNPEGRALNRRVEVRFDG
ncbi:OmpA family protein [Ornithinimicrobium pratense]|uniref:OmpA family protein n=1 Tax=Ornithinimicrobium pratense TaxID=2593973 RepID=A0A5J6V6Z7_9MICO|nr:OmpA family protein [Ornithinimicrobium pratense]QFG69377.1 OmpA family protein [Ornithinimicrobium pratense]